MKIKYLEIKNYKQFGDLTLDLTYPNGHEKAGEPLDKICIIGQSGTGKTNLLEIIKKSVVDFSQQTENSYLPFVGFSNNANLLSYIANKFVTSDKSLCEAFFSKVASKISSSFDIERSDNEKNYFVGVPSENIKIVKSSLINKMSPSDVSLYEKYIADIKHNNFIDRNIVNINDGASWELIKTRIDDYKDRQAEYISKLAAKLYNDDSYSKDNFRDDLAKWESENENILEGISEKLNVFLNKFNLELAKIDENQRSYNDLIIKDLSNGNIIEYDNLSTGTKNLLSTFIPLKLHMPQNSIILIDEPENSFYPDIQRQLADLYMSVGENNQLVFATHSPLIASSFEPWEIVELKFDKYNQVYREKYYEGENHVDNYILDPRLLTWTGILTNVFDLKEDSNFTYREKALMKYIRLERELKDIVDKDQKREKFEELMKLSELLGLTGNEKN